MPIFTVASARPRQELAMAIVEGEGQIKGLIGSQVLPDFPINRRTAHIIKATLQDTQALRIIAAAKYIRAAGTRFERMVAKFGDDTLSVTLRGVEIVVPNEVELDYADYLDVESFFASRFGTDISGLTKEYLIAQAIFNTTNFGSATNSAQAYTSANTTYAAYTGGTPTGISFIGDIIASARRLKAKGEAPPFVAVMSGLVFERIRQAFSVQQYVNGIFNAGQQATQNMIEAAVKEFGVEKILIGDSYYNSAADGATPSLSAIWSNTYIWVGRPGLSAGGGEEGVSVPSLSGVGACVYWEGFTPGGVPSTDKDTMAFEGGNYVESYPELTIDSMVLRLKMSSQPYIGNARAGDLISTQYS